MPATNKTLSNLVAHMERLMKAPSAGSHEPVSTARGVNSVRPVGGGSLTDVEVIDGAVQWGDVPGLDGFVAGRPTSEHLCDHNCTKSCESCASTREADVHCVLEKLARLALREHGGL